MADDARRVLVTLPLEDPDALASATAPLREAGFDLVDVEAVRERPGTVDALLTMGFRDLPEDLLARLTGLRAVAVATAGSDHVPRDRLPPGCRVMDAAGSNADTVAEHAVTLFLAARRGLAPLAFEAREGVFHQSPVGRPVAGARVVVLGLGHVGRAVAWRLAGLGCHVIGVNRTGNVPEDVAEAVAGMYTFEDRDAALAGADGCIVALARTPDTEGAVGSEELRAMASHGVLVNVARGAIVDRDALADHLDTHEAFGAGLDVWWTYPRGGGPRHEGWAEDPPLHRHPRVVATPHVAAMVPGHLAEQARVAAERLARALLDPS